MKFFIYSRKSVYTGKGESVENQIEMCREYIHAKFPAAEDLEITVYEDEGYSAKNTDRPQFKQMLRDIRLKSPDFVVCYRLDRISRNVSDFSALIEELNSRNISFICIKEEFDTSKPMGKAMMYIASVFAQLERETIAERVRDNMLMLARTGRWLGGTTPTGYTSERQQEIIIDGKIKTSCKLKDNRGELEDVLLMFDKYLELGSVSGVSKYLIELGVRSRSGKFYSLLGIKSILQNPVYCIADRDAFKYFKAQNSDVCFEEKDCSDKYGLLAYNKRDYKKKHAPRQTKDKWIIAIGKHNGCISGKKWVAVQNILQNNISNKKKSTKTHNDYALLSGLIECSKCGSRMFAKHRSNGGSNACTFDYVCNNKLRSGTALCCCQNINGNNADEMVYNCLIEYIIENNDICKLLEHLKKNILSHTGKNSHGLIYSQIEKYNTEMDNLVRAISRGNLDSAFIARVSAKISELEKKLAVLAEEHKRQQSITFPILKIQGTYPQYLSMHERRILVRQLINKIVWDGSNLHIFTN